MNFRTVGLTVGAGALLLVGFLIGKKQAGGAGDDAPIVVSGGSLHIMAAPGSKGNSTKHVYSIGADSGNANGLAHWTNGKQTGKSNAPRGVPQIEISYASGKARQQDTWMPASGHEGDPVSVTLGYCLSSSTFCAGYPQADDIITIYSDQQSLTFKSAQRGGTTQNDMNRDEQVFDDIWNHQPSDSKLFWVAINGKSYTCGPGSVECVVVIHFCNGSC